MNKKSFFLGVVTGIVLTFAVLFVIALVNRNSEGTDPIQYLETSFKVFQVVGNAALAREESDKIGGDVMYLGNTVFILGDDFYSNQVVTIKNPQRIGTYSYTNNGGMPMTVPVIDGESK